MLRGNVDTRLRKLDEGQYDAIVLAAAGLRRLGWQDRIRELIPVEMMCPAVGQGALAIETRDDGGVAHELVRKLDHADTRIAVTAERAMLEKLGGGCQVPIGGRLRFSRKGRDPDARDRGVARRQARGARGTFGRGSCENRGVDGSKSAGKGRRGDSQSPRHEGLLSRRGPRRSGTDYRQRQEDPGARRRRPLRQPRQRASAGARARAGRTDLRRQKARAARDVAGGDLGV